MQLDYLLVTYSMPFDCLIVNQMAKGKRKIERARKASELVSPFQRRGMGGNRAGMQKCVDYLLHIHVGREVPPMSSAGVRGLQALACPERAALTILGTLFLDSSDYGIMQEVMKKGDREWGLRTADVEEGANIFNLILLHDDTMVE